MQFVQGRAKIPRSAENYKINPTENLQNSYSGAFVRFTFFSTGVENWVEKAWRICGNFCFFSQRSPLKMWKTSNIRSVFTDSTNFSTIFAPDSTVFTLHRMHCRMFPLFHLFSKIGSENIFLIRFLCFFSRHGISPFLLRIIQHLHPACCYYCFYITYYMMIICSEDALQHSSLRMKGSAA